MELRRAAESVLRCNGSPLAPFLLPSSSSRWASRSPLTSLHPQHHLQSRAFSISPTRLASFKSVPTTRAPQGSDSPAESQEATPAPPSPEGEDITTPLSSWTQPGSRHSTSRFSSPSAQSNNRTPNSARSLPTQEIYSSSYSNTASSSASFKTSSPTSQGNRDSTATDLLAELTFASSTPQPTTWQSTNDPILPSTSRSHLASTQLLNNVLSTISPSPQKSIKHPMRLTPSTGRTVSISERIDVGRGFRLLEQSCARNKVRADFNYQRFHERGGLKRKRLRRERWRKRFFEGFKATIGRVRELTRQGW